MSNPFTELLGKIESKVWADQRTEKSPDKLLITVAAQLKLLKVLYRSMHEYDMREHMLIKDHKSYEDHTYKSNKAVLDYFLFINLLNQLGRILEEYSISLPNYNRIRFFRNKVSEHWEEYTKYGITGSHHQSFGEAAIPSTSYTFTPEKRKTIAIEINSILKQHGVNLDIENTEVSNIADFNVEKIYSILEKINPALASSRKIVIFSISFFNYKLELHKPHKNIIPRRLVELFFEFGFPPPIDNVKVYSNDLVSFLECELKIS